MRRLRVPAAAAGAALVCPAPLPAREGCGEQGSSLESAARRRWRNLGQASQWDSVARGSGVACPSFPVLNDKRSEWMAGVHLNQVQTNPQLPEGSLVRIASAKDH